MKKQVTAYNTSANFVYKDLRARIISKQLVPGTRLTEIAIAQQFKVSRTPVRDALRRLASEELVIIRPNCGASVTQPTGEEIRGAYAVRQQLELFSVAEAAVGKTDKKNTAGITRIIADERRALVRGEFETLLNLDNAFHKAIAEISKNPVLIEFTEKILSRTNIYLLFFASLGRHMEDNSRQHEEIMHAILAKDKELAEVLMKNHLRLAYSMLKIPEEQTGTKKRDRGKRTAAAASTV